MKAGVWEGPGVIRCRERGQPRPGPGELLVQVAYCGFCGSDSHIIEGRYRIGPPPQVIGHEVSGVVVEAGPGVDQELVSRSVGCSPVAYCGLCSWCRSGVPTHCRNQVVSMAGFAEYAVYRPQQLFALPERLSLRDAAFLEPVAICLRAVETARLRVGDRVLVIGGGALGLLVASLARLVGAATVTVSEPRQRNRELALARGADAAVDPLADDLSDAAPASESRRGFDVVFEAAGSVEALELSPSLLARGGRVVVLGVFDRDVTIAVHPELFNRREISVLGSVGGGGHFEPALGLLDGLDLATLITATEPLERIDELYAAISAGEHVKAMVQP